MNWFWSLSDLANIIWEIICAHPDLTIIIAVPTLIFVAGEIQFSRRKE